MKSKSWVNLFATTCLSFSLAVPILEGNMQGIGKNNAMAQVNSAAFKRDAVAATSKYNNLNLVCADYVKALYNFVKPNATKYKIATYTVYKLEAKSIGHEDYKGGKEPISLNGVHYFLDIDGYSFDNHHPEGKLPALFVPGFVVTTKPLITPITIDDVKSGQC
jgi:hypothetical protein